MKIAFVGKGGSGKSTVSALFIRHLLANNQNVLAVDADINQHLAGLLGADFRPEFSISQADHKLRAREHLRGTNKRIESAKKFVKTTPPGRGSNLVRIAGDDPLLAQFATRFGGSGHFMHVGTYTADGIGASCYHSDLAVFENVLSHTVTGQNDWLVADMVAGTDAFAGALYLLFDVVFLVVEPTPESVGVFMQFRKLAEEADTFGRVFVIGNKVIDADDARYLAEAVGDKLVATIGYDNTLRKQRQRGNTIAVVPSEQQESMVQIEQFARRHQPDANEQLQRLHDLHRYFAGQGFTIAKYGDLRDQVDGDFRFAPIQ